MKRILVLACMLSALHGLPVRAQPAEIITPFFVAMLAGPVSDGPSVILVKKRPNFVSWETPFIACVSGFGAGALAAALPTLASGGLLLPMYYVTGYGIYGCVVSAVGGAIGVATDVALKIGEEKEAAEALETGMENAAPPPAVPVSEEKEAANALATGTENAAAAPLVR